MCDLCVLVLLARLVFQAFKHRNFQLYDSLYTHYRISHTHAAFLDYRVGAVHVSAKGKKVIQQMAKGEKVSHESSGLSKREWNELMMSFEFKDKLV